MARPRDPTVDRAIHEATLALLAARGLAGVTIEAVATHAGVARSTVYRRHHDVAALVEDAVAALLPLPQPDSADDGREGWADLVESLRRALLETRVGLPVLGALLVAEDDHPELLEVWRSRVVASRVRVVAEWFGWSSQDSRQYAELALGGLIAAHVAEGSVDPERARDLADLLWDRIIAPGPRTPLT